MTWSENLVALDSARALERPLKDKRKSHVTKSYRGLLQGMITKNMHWKKLQRTPPAHLP